MATTADKHSERLETADLDLHPNEASDLARVEREELVSAHGWDLAFWTVLDEGAVEDSIAVLGRRSGRGDGPAHWEVIHPRFDVGHRAGKTEDAEACTVHDGYVYVVGSHYGSKEGPLERTRAFLARFREDEFGLSLSEQRPRLEVVRNDFRLHRAVNDAMRAFGPEVGPIGKGLRKAFVKRARKQAGKKRKPLLSPRDAPLNIEGASFRADGSLLIALRYPVTAEGHPILVELRGIATMFEDERAAPVVRRFWVLRNVGTADLPIGFRALNQLGGELHAIVGSLDSDDSDSVLIEEHPEGGAAPCAHYRFDLSPDKDGGEVDAAVVERFDLKNVEGLAGGPNDQFFYVTDEDERVHIRCTRLASGDSAQTRRGGAKAASSSGRGASRSQGGASRGQRGSARKP